MQSLRIATTTISNLEADYLILAGATAVGKTDTLLSLAEQASIEVISADSRQVYRGMDIGTATPEVALLERIPHHFINELNPDVVWNAGSFYREARERIRDIISRGLLPVVAGGAGLYLEALRNGFFSEEGKDLEVRRKYEQRLESIGAEALWEELHSLDSDYADSFHFNDHKKLVRAFEIYESSGLVPSEAFAGEDRPFELKEHFLILDRDRAELYERINLRVLQMVEQGLVEECQSLQEAGYTDELYPLRTIGYKEVFAQLRGELSQDEMIALIQKNTRNFAKRQLTWFRNHPFDQMLSL